MSRRRSSGPREIAELRLALLDAGLTEELKWRKPCYSYRGKNIVIVQKMKDFLDLMFFKGALLSDPDGVLEDQGPNSRSARRIRFTSVEDVSGRPAPSRPTSRRPSPWRIWVSRWTRRPSWS